MLELTNSILAKASKDRYEIRVSKNGVYYLYDYDFREIVRSKAEIRDIIDNQFLNEFTSDPDVFTFLEEEVF